MAVIKPFRGTRYTEKAGELAQLCCPPYDIISEEGRKELLSTNEHNIIRLELPRSYKDGAENEDMASYTEAGETLRNWVASGIMQDDADENIYVYEFSWEHEEQGSTSIREVKGFVALVQLAEFSEGIVLPHEETLSKAKTDRFNLMTATKANFSQVYSLYSDAKGELQGVLESATQAPPTSCFTDEGGVTHKLWAVSDAAVCEQIAELMADKQVFIADGHHRYETALKYSKENADGASGTSGYIPMMLVSMDNPALLVLPTHRLVRDLPDFSGAELVEKCREFFYVKESLSREDALEKLGEAYDKGLHAFALYMNRSYTLLILKEKAMLERLLPDMHESLRCLDVTVLHSLVLERILGIDKANMAAQVNLTYVKLAQEAIAAVDSGAANCAFLMNATRVGEIRDTALNGLKMPQKSTYFYPKLTTGLVINRIVK
ncbi:MAG: DUF1015 domain-containing protein [Oscillospiraceae bacterium]|nr:DUF1015 domain-containing protein [Oscillospiraceae bacterium]